VRVAITIERFAEGPGGAELDTAQLVRELIERDVEVTVVCHTARLEERPGLTIRRLRLPRAWQPVRLLWFSRAAARATASGFDVVHSFARTRHQTIYRSGGGTHAGYLEHSYRRPGLQRLSPRHRAILWVEEAVFRDPSQVIHCICRSGADEIRTRYGVDPARLVVIYNGVDSVRFHPDVRARHRETLRRELGLDGPVALYVGGGFHRKGLDRAVAGLASAPAGTQLLVAGGGDPGPYRAQAARLGLAERVHFLGFRRDVDALHGCADLVVLPTRYDPFGNVVLEAMASGLPVATTAAAGASELIEHGKNGFVYGDDFGPAFAALCDPAGLAVVGAAARQTAERYTWAQHAEEVLALYEKVRR
jgi:UDP-glucose:(heptosyl)LPS alpha-1,3-glucosyltransferase